MLVSEGLFVDQYIAIARSSATSDFEKDAISRCYDKTYIKLQGDLAVHVCIRCTR